MKWYYLNNYINLENIKIIQKEVQLKYTIF